MAKKAYLVTFSICTRVVVNVADCIEDENPETNDELWKEIVDKAENRVSDNLWDYLNYDNVESVKEDTACPFGTFTEDNKVL